MRLRLEAEPEELRERGDALIKALIDSVSSVAPDLAERLEKALPKKQKELKYKVLQEIAKKTHDEYVKQVEAMVKDIGKVLDRSLQKAESNLDEDAAEEQEDKPEPGDIDPETGDLIPEPEDEESEGEGEEEESIEKAGPYIGPRGGRWSDPDHTIPWVESGAVKVNTKKILHDNLGIKREDMPQIRSDLVPDFIRTLMGIGVKVERSHEDVGDLKATQSELNKEKVAQLISDPKARANLAKPIIVSKDGHVLDGHHRWAAMVAMDPHSEIPTVEVDLTMNDLLAHAKKYKQVKFKTLEKAGPFIGPRGGKWADVEHTIPWKQERPASIPGSLVTKVKALGGKVKPHKTDPNKSVVKVPLKYAKELAKLKQKYNLKDEIKLGSNYAILAIDGKVVKSKLKKTPVKAPQAPAEPAKMPPYVDPEFKLPDTQGGCIQWLADKGITAEFPDLATAQEVTKALSEQHPFVLQNIQFIGTPDQLKQWATLNPEMNESAKNAKHPMDLTKSSPLGGGALAVAHPITKKPYTMSVVVVKGSWWNSGKAATSGSYESDGFSVSKNLGDVVRHECGHVEGFAMRHLKPAGPDGPQMWEIWKEHCVPMLKTNKKQLMADVSHYGATNPHECWAEVSVLRRTGKKLAGWIQDALAAMKIDSSEWGPMMGSV